MDIKSLVVADWHFTVPNLFFPSGAIARVLSWTFVATAAVERPTKILTTQL